MEHTETLMDYYQLLGIPRDAERAEIIHAAKRKNAELKAALAILTDPVKRRAYDDKLARLAAASAALEDSRKNEVKTVAHGPSMVTKIRYLGIFEGISFLLLLGVAMPLKYFAGIPAAVYWIGSLHGILFVLYLVYLIAGAVTVPIPLGPTLLGVLSSITPFGPFFLERKLRRYEPVAV